MSKGSYEDFFEALGRKESSNNYLEINTLGYIGKYQFGEPSLIDLGYYRKDGTEKHDFLEGYWVGKDEINSKQDFLNNPSIQEKAVRDYAELNFKRFKYYEIDQYEGQIINGVKITMSGMLAGAHLKGVEGSNGLMDYLIKNINDDDGYGTRIEKYIKDFADYETPFVADHSQGDTIDGSNGHDVLNGHGGDDTLIGGDEQDSYIFKTGDGKDTIIDNDGNIYLDNSLISGTAKETATGSHVYLMDDLVLYYSGGALTIMKNGSSDEIVIRNYEDGKFNITLEENKDDGVDDGIDDGMDDMGRAEDAITPIDPLVIDLDGDGVELVSAEDSNAYFDLNGDGFDEKTGWVKADDGLLAYDQNHNGRIDNIDELFGSQSQTGFDELKELGSNKDGVINTSDTEFSNIYVWQDKNGNGKTEDGEMKKLSDYGINSIETNPVSKIEREEGNIITGSSSYSKSNGFGKIYEVLFETDSVDSKINNVEFHFGEDFELDPEALALPNSRGYGKLYDFHIAMTLDSELKAKMIEK